jgi:hypothetical protein
VGFQPTEIGAVPVVRSKTLIYNYMNKKIKPIIDETYWSVYQNYNESNHYLCFMLHDIFHFNSLSSTHFLDQRSPYEQLRKSFIYIPERIIKNNNSKLFLKNKDILIKKELPFIRILDDYEWLVDDNIIKEYENTVL